MSSGSRWTSEKSDPVQRRTVVAGNGDDTGSTSRPLYGTSHTLTAHHVTDFGASMSASSSVELSSTESRAVYDANARPIDAAAAPHNRSGFDTSIAMFPPDVSANRFNYATPGFELSMSNAAHPYVRYSSAQNFPAPTGSPGTLTASPATVPPHHLSGTPQHAASMFHQAPHRATVLPPFDSHPTSFFPPTAHSAYTTASMIGDTTTPSMMPSMFGSASPFLGSSTASGPGFNGMPGAPAFASSAPFFSYSAHPHAHPSLSSAASSNALGPGNSDDPYPTPSRPPTSSGYRPKSMSPSDSSNLSGSFSGTFHSSDELHPSAPSSASSRLSRASISPRSLSIDTPSKSSRSSVSTSSTTSTFSSSHPPLTQSHPPRSSSQSSSKRKSRSPASQSTSNDSSSPSQTHKASNSAKRKPPAPSTAAEAKASDAEIFTASASAQRSASESQRLAMAAAMRKSRTAMNQAKKRRHGASNPPTIEDLDESTGDPAYSPGHSTEDITTRPETTSRRRPSRNSPKLGPMEEERNFEDPLGTELFVSPVGMQQRQRRDEGMRESEGAGPMAYSGEFTMEMGMGLHESSSSMDDMSPNVVMAKSAARLAFASAHVKIRGVREPILGLKREGALLSIEHQPTEHQVKDFNIIPMPLIKVRPDASPKLCDFVAAFLYCEDTMNVEDPIFLTALNAKLVSNHELPFVNLRITKEMLKGRTKGFSFVIGFTYVSNGRELETIFTTPFWLYSNVNQEGFPKSERDSYLRPQWRDSSSSFNAKRRR